MANELMTSEIFEEENLLEKTVIPQEIAIFSVYKPELDTVIMQSQEYQTLSQLRRYEKGDAEEYEAAAEGSDRLLAYNTDLNAIEVLRWRNFAEMYADQAPEARAMLEEQFHIDQKAYLYERYEAADGLVYEQKTQDGNIYTATGESLTDMMRRGVEHRKGLGTLEDEVCEQAEVDFMEELGKQASDKNTPPGTIWLNVSLPNGKFYQHDFFDEFQKTERNGVTYLQMQRFATTLGAEDYMRILPQMTDGEVQYDHIPTPAELRSHPIRLPLGKFANFQEVRSMLYRETNKEFTDEATMEEILQRAEPYMRRYIDTVFQYPNQSEKYKDAFRAMINAADGQAYFSKHNQHKDTEMEQIFAMPFFQAADALAARPADMMVSDCGFGFGAEEVNGGMLGGRQITVANGSPFSVGEFAFGGNKNKKWEYNNSGICQGPCGRNFKERGLGPCNICADCEDKVPMLSASQLANPNKETNMSKPEASEKKLKTKKEKRLFTISPNDLLVSIKKEIPAPDKRETSAFNIPKESEEKGWKIDIFRLARQRSEQEEKKHRDKQTMFFYAMNEEREEAFA